MLTTSSHILQEYAVACVMLLDRAGPARTVVIATDVPVTTTASTATELEGSGGSGGHETS